MMKILFSSKTIVVGADRDVLGLIYNINYII